MNKLFNALSDLISILIGILGYIIFFGVALLLAGLVWNGVIYVWSLIL